MYYLLNKACLILLVRPHWVNQY